MAVDGKGTREEKAAEQQTLPSTARVFGDRYVVQEELGRGGMGRVLRARDLKLTRDVALKLLAPGAHDEQQRLRFEQEARAAAALNHPNILAVYDIGEQGGEPFIVTELLEGETLRSVLSRGPFAPGNALELATQLAEGLAAAHAAGIIHRDVKPENLFLTRQGHLKILDFGIAKLLEGTRAPGVLHTDTGAVMGTPGYMSPEQVRGERATARSDIFAFGAVLHEMLAGSGPFERPSGVDAAHAILHDPPERLPPSVPAAFSRTVAGCLQKDPAARPADAGDVLAELRKISPAAQPRRRGGFFAAAAIALLAAAAAIVFLRPRPAPVAVQPSVAVLPFADLSPQKDQEYFSDGIAEEIINALAQVEGLHVVGRTSSFSFKGKSEDLRGIGQKLNVAHVLEGSVRKEGNRVRVTAQLVGAADGYHIWSKTFDRELTGVFAIQEEISRAVVEALEARLMPGQRPRQRTPSIEAVDPEAHDAYLKGRFQVDRRNVESFKKGLEYFQQAVQINPGYALAYVGIASCYGLLAFYGGLPPSEAIPREKEAALKAAELNPLLAETHVQLGFLHDQEWNHSAAESEFKRAIELSPNSSDAHHGYSLLLMVLGRYDEALKENRRKRELDPLWPGSFGAGATICYYARRYEEGIELARKSLQLNPNFSPGHFVLGQIYEQQGRYAEALEELRSAQKSDSDSPFLLSTLGHIYAMAGRTQDAERVLQQLQQNSRIGYASAYNVAAVYAGLRRKDEALAWLNKAFADRDPWVTRLSGDPRFDDLRADARFGELLRRMGLPPHPDKP